MDSNWSVPNKVVRSSPPTGARGKVFIEKMRAKQRNYLIAYSLRLPYLGKLSWLFVIGVLKF